MTQSVQTRPLSVFFFEDWGEDGESSLIRRGLGYFLGGMAGDCYQRILWLEFAGEGARATRSVPRCSQLLWGDVAGSEVNAVGGGGDCYVGAGVDQEGSFQFPVLSSQFMEDAYRFAGQLLQVARGEIFFAELDVVDALGCGFGDFVEEPNAAGVLAAGEGGPVGDVVEEQAFSFQLSVISLRQERQMSW